MKKKKNSDRRITPHEKYKKELDNGKLVFLIAATGWIVFCVIAFVVTGKAPL